ncbi:hypothetical protein N7509_012912 [Penicillium cosmopolitanum]|uniref:Uncharacterized protein n=1 Tax=Penicillium cosmopolitanum TaxID=1131564 RepID=A0A9W9SCD3_9EURO|nr:uncharacterized protein N7509_012912 [Penicillium cosmopolitanum]KAJ5376026.1 hypothetical protein N7509_012912 [Penicillium cosmopolitanum]
MSEEAPQVRLSHTSSYLLLWLSQIAKPINTCIHFGLLKGNKQANKARQIKQVPFAEMFKDDEGKAFLAAMASPLAMRIKEDLNTKNNPLFMTGTSEQIRLARFNKNGVEWERNARLNDEGSLVLSPVPDPVVFPTGAASTSAASAKKTQPPKKDTKKPTSTKASK